MEDSEEGKLFYTTSWAFVGPQIGLFLALIETLTLELLIPEEYLIAWGWRLAFFVATLLGALGIFLRKRLHETEKYKELENIRKVVDHPVKMTITSYKLALALVFGVSIFEVTTFCLLTVVPTLLYPRIFHITQFQNLMIQIASVIPCFVLPPWIGMLKDKLVKLPFLKISAWAIAILSLPYYWSIYQSNIVAMLLVHALMLFPFVIQVALLPSLIAGMFPVHVRYTGVGFSFNICDGLLWSGIPILSVLLVHWTKNPASYVILLPITAILFLFVYPAAVKMKKRSQLMELNLLGGSITPSRQGD